MKIVLIVLLILFFSWVIWYKSVNKNANWSCGGLPGKICPVGFICEGERPEVDGVGNCKKILPF